MQLISRVGYILILWSTCFFPTDEILLKYFKLIKYFPFIFAILVVPYNHSSQQARISGSIEANDNHPTSIYFYGLKSCKWQVSRLFCFDYILDLLFTWSSEQNDFGTLHSTSTPPECFGGYRW